MRKKTYSASLRAGTLLARHGCWPDSTTDAEFGVLLPCLPSPRQVLLPSLAGPHAGEWLTAISGGAMQAVAL